MGFDGPLRFGKRETVMYFKNITSERPVFCMLGLGSAYFLLTSAFRH